MKLEKINENQIRCTLTNADLSSRKINLTELAYGSEKAKNLFYDMMKQAQSELGFEVNGTPIMIEAIPTLDSLILNITKVSSPEELDTRFSSFSNSQPASSSELHFSGADGILNLFKKIREATEKTSEPQPKDQKTETAKEERTENLIEAFRFTSLDDVIAASGAVGNMINTENSLYKYETNVYLLIYHCSNDDPELSNRICNILSEYSMTDHCFEATEKYLREHGYLMIADNALQKLSQL